MFESSIFFFFADWVQKIRVKNLETFKHFLKCMDLIYLEF